MASSELHTGGGSRSTDYLPAYLHPSPSLTLPKKQNHPPPATYTTNLSDRPLSCLDIHTGSNPFIVVGSTDHALYKVNPTTGEKVATLYTKQHGHTEWVNNVVALPGGRVLSGGMDSKLCLWDAPRRGGTGGGERCIDLKGHGGSVTSVKCERTGTWAISSSYDGTLRIWNLTHGREVEVLGGDIDGALSRGDYMAATRNPILDFTWLPLSPSTSTTSTTQNPSSALLASTRDGRIHTFDITSSNPSQPTTTIRAHQGPVRHTHSQIPSSPHPSLIYSCGNLDGAIRCFDPRLPPERGRCIRKLENLHSGGITNMVVLPDRGMIATTGGADGTIKILDPKSLEVVREINVPGCERGTGQYPVPGSSAYAVVAADKGKIVSSWGDGRVVILEDVTKEDSQVIELDHRAAGLKNACKSMFIYDGVIYAAGDDGSVVSWNMGPR